MGLLNAIGKMAGSKIVEKVEDEFAKKQNREQTGGYCKYIKSNLARVSQMITELKIETETLVGQIQVMKGVKLPFREKGNFRNTKDKANKNLKYLYLIQDFFTALAKNASGLILKNEELMLVTKFAPYFDGVPVLDINDDEDSDYSVLGTFKEVGQELKEVFISSKKGSNRFDFDEYLDRYSEKIEEYVIPNIDSAIQSFNSVMIAQEAPSPSIVEVPVAVAQVALLEKTECPNCHKKLAANAKFCSECGNKLEANKLVFCTECGKPINLGSKFCSSCGTKIG